MKNTFIQVLKQFDKFVSTSSGTNTTDELMRSFAEILEENFLSEYLAFYIYDNARGCLKLPYATGLTEKESQLAEHTVMERQTGRAFKSGKTIYIPDIRKDSTPISIITETHREIRSLLFIPVINTDKAIGVLEIADLKPSAYGEEDITLLSLIINFTLVLYTNILNLNTIKSETDQLKSIAKLPFESSNPVLRISKDNILLYANPASNQLLAYHGVKTGEAVSKDFKAGLNSLSNHRKTIEKEIEDGEHIYSFLFTKVEDADYVNLYGRDITGKKATEKDLKKMALLAEETENAVIITNRKGEIEWINGAFTRITGYNLKEIKGKIPEKFLQGEETDPKTVAQLAEAIRTQTTIEVDIINYSKSQKKYWINIQIQPVFDKHGLLKNFISIQKEITKEKEIEQELIRTTTFQKAILNSSAIAIISTDLHGIIQSFNPAASSMLGYDANEVIGIETPHLFHDKIEIRKRNENNPDQETKNFRIFKINDDQPNPENIVIETGEFTFIRKDGSKFPVSLTVTALRDRHNKVNGFLAMVEDITQRKEQFDALQIANLRFRLLISSMQAGIMVEDDQRKVVLVNQRFCDIFSIPVPAEQLIGMDCELAAETSKVLFDDPETFIKDINNTLALQNVVINHELRMSTGTFLERDFVPVENPGKEIQGILWIYRDITQRKNYERDLLRQSEILNGTAQAMNYLLTLPDHDQAIQKAITEIGNSTSTDRVYIFENQEDELTGEAFFSQRFEWAKKGVLPQIDNPELQNIPFSEGFPRWYKLLKAGKIVSGMVKNFPEEERAILESQDIISIIVVPVFVQNRLWGMVGFDDCTHGIEWTTNESSILTALAASIGGRIARKIIENELIDARHIAEYATKSKSEFLATMSHEIRTPMNGVIGMTSLLMQTSLTPDQRDYAETIKISGELLLELINDILDFSKIESGNMILEEHSFDLRLAIEDVIDLMATAAFSKKLGLFFQVDPNIPQFIKGDLTRLRQIIVNLVGNAIKFTSHGEVVIRVRQIERRKNEAVLQFSVRDTGIGIPEEKADRLFKPFSQIDASTTRKYGGTGLGLAISSKLVALMNGNIWINNDVDSGSEFLFTIKTMYRPEDNKELHIPKQNLVKGKYILITDSNFTSSEILSNLLTGLEMKPRIVHSKAEMLNILKANENFDIILIDQDIADQDGFQLFTELKSKEKYKNIPIVLLSDPTLTESESVKKLNFNSRINKPLKHSQLVSVIAKLISMPGNQQKQQVIEPKSIGKLNEKFPLAILVAEDNAINQKMMLSLFDILGYSIHIAANGFEAIDTLKRMKIDIVFMDIQMPEMDGLEATRQIIADWGDKRPLIVAMTANALESDKEKCLDAGMDDYISKPLTINQIFTGIEKWAPLCNLPGKKA
jgi:PAS domain S-box-containing protein